MNKQHYNSGALSKIRRRGGAVTIYFALTLVLLLGAAGLAVDMGHLYIKRTQAQVAADAAALAGAIQHLYGNINGANQSARNVAAANGYPVVTGTTVNCGINLSGDRKEWYEVRLGRDEPLFFMSIFGVRTRHVSAYAAAEFQVPANMGINGSFDYGAVGPVTLSHFGPFGQFQHGDPYSARYLDNANPNPLYNPNGYNYEISVPQDFRTRNNLSQSNNKIKVEIFDPDSYNSGNNSSPATGSRLDEYHDPTTAVKNKFKPVQAVTTRYKLQYRDANDPTLFHDISSASYGRTSATDMQWIQPSGFEINLGDARWSNRFWEPNTFRVNVVTTDGSSENGFSLRAGPTTGNWNKNNGTSITATGNIVLNFTGAGTTNIKLGYVPAGSTSISINKFDTDVGAVAVSYTDGTNTYQGYLSGNGDWRLDTFVLPANYAGGNWVVNYQASTQDTSLWKMSYTGPKSVGLGSVRLVR